jgi:hypothetical protein
LSGNYLKKLDNTRKSQKTPELLASSRHLESRHIGGIIEARIEKPPSTVSGNEG